jgi:hypothetical protein
MLQLARATVGGASDVLKVVVSTRKLIEDLKTSPELFDRSVAIRDQIIDHLRTKPYYAALWNNIKSRIIGVVTSKRFGFARRMDRSHPLRPWRSAISR